MTLKVEYSLLALFMAFAYAVIVTLLPDFPIDEQTVLALLVYVLMRLGVEVIGKPAIRALFPNKFKSLRTPPE